MLFNAPSTAIHALSLGLFGRPVASKHIFRNKSGDAVCELFVCQNWRNKPCFLWNLRWCWGGEVKEDFSGIMSTKVIYFLVGDRPEQAEFRSDFPADDVKGKQTTGFSQFVCFGW